MTVLATVLPIFALILAGFVFARSRRLDEAAVTVLNLYVVWLALPALLFDFVAAADWHALGQPRFVAVFGGAMLAVFAASLWLSPRAAGRPRPLVRRAIDALSSSYSNTAYMGIPLVGGLFGAEGLAGAVIASLLTVCALFALTIVLVEIDLDPGGSRWRAIGRVARSVIRNPLVAAPLAGALWAMGGFAIPVPVAGFLKLLGATASPVALVTIGTFLAQRRGRGEPRELAVTVTMKLVVQPMLTLALLVLLPLPRHWAAAAVLIAALPTGTGPFMVAQLYRQEVTLAARTILVSTLLSVVTVSALAWWLAG